MLDRFAASFLWFLLCALLLGAFGLALRGWLLYPAAGLFALSLVAGAVYCLRAPLPTPISRVIRRR
jgi:hypothetical protein